MKILWALTFLLSCLISNVFASTTINGVAAIVNNQIITQQELAHAVHQAVLMAQDQGTTLPVSKALEQHVIQQMIIQKVALQIAKKNGIAVSDQAVNAQLNNLMIQHHISNGTMMAMLNRRGTTLAQYKEALRRQLMITKLEQEAVAGSIIVAPEAVDAYLKERQAAGPASTLYHIQHILIPLPAKPTAAALAKTKATAETVIAKVKKGMSFSAAARTYSQSGDANTGGDLGWKTLTQLPLLFVKYAPDMKPGQLEGPIKADGAFHIIKLVGEKSPADQKHTITQYHTSQILIKISPVMDAAGARNLLQHVITAFNNGVTFNTLAKRYSQDIHTASKGGSMGWVSQDNASPDMYAHIQALGKNKISKPFATQNGWHVVEVTGKRTQDDTKAFMRHQARQAIFEQKAEKAVLTWQEKLRGQAYVKILV
jgi:peptidyl-prolyl cis-trans isomerase SurA